ncbi:polysaccharide lyase family 7 protein [Colwellia sp. MSW7]|uniref:Polysaccharide lyase family 7 protein n=1 Tax=Colwellia maritima TaxID=2912588 RepID=A0ABS9X2B4_9GAMM|nr:polysaccharide lyase family 7 protein [Colwellia maritima]MCI2284392.1 polysaccharide lyase family 7 protein [Colwellia maritima]
MKHKKFTTSVTLLCLALASCSENKNVETQQVSHSTPEQQVPASKFDLSHWYLTVPLDKNKDGVSDIYDVAELETYSHPDFFYLDNDNNMVFASPNRAATERTSTNTRSELRYMIRGKNQTIAESSLKNNFALVDNQHADKYAAIGGKLEATLHVDHVAKNAKYPNKPPAYSVVVGQVHSFQLPDEEHIPGYGRGNEPLKISYKKWPNHDKGSVFWTYERNLATDDPNRIDIAYSVWGSNWDDATDPGENGIALGEKFSYTVNIDKNTMYLTFTSENHETVHHQINLADNVDVNGKVDNADYPFSYKDETMYFKAGAYNQCSTKDHPTSFRYPACPGTGNWAVDVKNGDYTKVTFSKLVVSSSTPM